MNSIKNLIFWSISYFDRTNWVGKTLHHWREYIFISTPYVPIWDVYMENRSYGSRKWTRMDRTVLPIRVGEIPKIALIPHDKEMIVQIFSGGITHDPGTIKTILNRKSKDHSILTWEFLKIAVFKDLWYGWSWEKDTSECGIITILDMSFRMNRKEMEGCILGIIRNDLEGPTSTRLLLGKTTSVFLSDLSILPRISVQRMKYFMR